MPRGNWWMKQKTHLFAQVEISDGRGGSSVSPQSAPLRSSTAPCSRPWRIEPQANPRLPALEVKVDGVPERPAVDGHEVVARPEPGGRGRRPRAHAPTRRHPARRRASGDAAHGVERPLAGAAGGIDLLQALDDVCRPDPTVNGRGDPREDLGHAGQGPK